MKVISGSARGIPLKVPEQRKGQQPRPITDRIKESLFSILMWELPSAEVLDLFAGSGALGIEALSRGAGHAVFVEREKRCCNIIKENIASVKFTDCSEVLLSDALLAAQRLVDRQKSFDIIFVDPPFAQTEDSGQAKYFQDMWSLFGEGLLKEEGKVILRCQQEAVVPEALESVASMSKGDERTYNRSVIHFYHISS